MTPEMQPLNPWRRIPDHWICAECGSPADGFNTARGIIAFSCESHYDAVADVLMERLGYGSLGGYAVVRYSWTYRIQDVLWRFAYWPNVRRRTFRREQESLLDSIFPASDVRAEPTLLERNRP